MKSYKTGLPTEGLIQRYLPVDYTDAFACEVPGASKLSADKIMINFWTVMPGWVNMLLKLRNLLVRPFGLKTGDNSDRSEKLKKMIRMGSGNNDLMSLVAKSDTETIVLLSDKHLDAYMSVYIQVEDCMQVVTATTLVKYHNRLGKIYFFFIRPFHKVIVKSMLRNTLKRM